MTTWTTHPDRAKSGDKKQRKKMKNETVQTATQVKINVQPGWAPGVTRKFNLEHVVTVQNNGKEMYE